MDCDFDDNDILLDIEGIASNAIDGLLPEKSRGRYEVAFGKLKEWCQKNQAKEVTETVLLAYFFELSKKYRPSTLWAEYYMVKTCLAIKENLDIKKYAKLTVFFKRKSTGYRPKKSRVLTKENIDKFLIEAPDKNFLLTKVALIIGVAGASRREELAYLSIDDIRQSENYLVVAIPNTETYKERSFVINAKNDEQIDVIDYYRRYAKLRPPCTEHRRLFINYKEGKCTKQAVGVNTFGKMSCVVASYLKLENPSEYTGHCFRRTSATLLVNSGGDILSLKRHGGWKSSSIAEEYIEESIGQKIKIARQIFATDTLETVKQEQFLVRNGENDVHNTAATATPGTIDQEQFLVKQEQLLVRNDENHVQNTETEVPEETKSDRVVPKITVENCSNCTTEFHVHYSKK